MKSSLERTTNQPPSKKYQDVFFSGEVQLNPNKKDKYAFFLGVQIKLQAKKTNKFFFLGRHKLNSKQKR